MSDMNVGDMKDGVIFNSTPTNKVQIVLVKGGESLVLNLDPKSAADIAGEALQAARMCHDRTGKTLPSGTERESSWPTVIPSSIALGPCKMPNHESLIVRFGEAALGFAIPRGILLSLGQALITASASEDGPD